MSATNRNIVDCCSSLHHQNKRIKIDDLFHGIFCGDLTDGGGGTVVLRGSFITFISLNNLSLFVLSICKVILVMVMVAAYATVLRDEKVKKCSFTLRNHYKNRRKRMMRKYR